MDFTNHPFTFQFAIILLGFVGLLLALKALVFDQRDRDTPPKDDEKKKS